VTLHKLQANIGKLRALGMSDTEIAHRLGYTVELLQQIVALQEW
jgi:DNA-binding CsgD family transcriptional regulator